MSITGSHDCKIIFSRGLSYEGGFKGCAHGEGTIYYKDQPLTATFNNGKIVGPGTYKFKDGSIFVGTFSPHPKNGLSWHLDQGKLTYTNENYYIGKFFNDKPHGYGIMHINSTKYEGLFNEGKFLQYGKATLINGDKYTGDFSNYQFHGRGKYFHSSTGHIYLGNFDHGDIKGKIQIEFPNGDYYDGIVKNWMPHGYGQLTTVDKHIFLGYFKNGYLEGFGQHVLPCGKIDGKTYVHAQITSTIPDSYNLGITQDTDTDTSADATETPKFEEISSICNQGIIRVEDEFIMI